MQPPHIYLYHLLYQNDSFCSNYSNCKDLYCYIFFLPVTWLRYHFDQFDTHLWLWHVGSVQHFDTDGLWPWPSKIFDTRKARTGSFWCILWWIGAVKGRERQKTQIPAETAEIWAEFRNFGPFRPYHTWRFRTSHQARSEGTKSPPSNIWGWHINSHINKESSYIAVWVRQLRIRMKLS